MVAVKNFLPSVSLGIIEARVVLLTPIFLFLVLSLSIHLSSAELIGTATQREKINSTYSPVFFWNYRYYADEGSDNSWAHITVKKYDTNSIANTTTLDVGKDRYFLNLNLSVKLLKVKALPDGNVTEAVIDVTPVQTISPTWGATLADYKHTILASDGIAHSWVKLVVRELYADGGVGKMDIEQATINESGSKDFPSIGISVKVLSVYKTYSTEQNGSINPIFADVLITPLNFTYPSSPSPIAIPPQPTTIFNGSSQNTSISSQSPITEPTSAPVGISETLLEPEVGILLDTVVRLEVLKTRSDSIERASREIADYWESVGEYASATKWKNFQKAFESLKSKIDSSANFIKSIKDKPTKDDYEKIKSDMKNVATDLSEIIDSI